MRPLVLCSNDDGVEAPYLEALATRIEEFANEIRWNAAYYFLSGTV